MKSNIFTQQDRDIVVAHAAWWGRAPLPYHLPTLISMGEYVQRGERAIMRVVLTQMGMVKQLQAGDRASK